MGARTRVLFLDAADDVLVRRYEESRRKHPARAGERVSEGIAAERALLEDPQGAPPTSSSTPPTSTCTSSVTDCRSSSPTTSSDSALQVQRRVVRVQARSAHRRRSRVRLPPSCPTRTGSRSCRPLTGTDPRVRDYVLGASRPRRFFSSSSSGCSRSCLPAYVREGKSYLSIGVGCTGGRHPAAWSSRRSWRGCSKRTACHRAFHHRDVDRG